MDFDENKQKTRVYGEIPKYLNKSELFKCDKSFD